MAKFETQVFDDVAPAQYRPTTRVDPSAGKFAETIGSAAGDLVTRLDKIKKYDLKAEAGKIGGEVSKVFEPDQAAFNLYADSIRSNTLNSYVGEKGEHFLSESLAARLNIENLDDPVLKEASQTFKNIAYARGQGSTAEDAYHLQTMASLAKLQNRYPAYREEIRKLSKKHLGFDPTNADIAESINSLNAIDAEKRRKANEKAPLTEEQRARNALIAKNPELVLKHLALSGSTDDGVYASAMRESYTKKLSDEKDILDIHFGNQRMSDDQFGTGAQATVDSYLMDAITVTGSAVKKGGVYNPDQLYTEMATAVQQAVVLAKTKAGNKISDEAARNLDTYAQSRLSFMKTFVDGGSYKTFIEQGNERDQAAALGILLKNPQLLAAYSYGGPQSAYQYVQAMNLAGSNKGIFNIFSRTNPMTGSLSTMGKAVKEGRWDQEAPAAVERTLNGQGDEDDKKAAALITKQHLVKNGGTTDQNGKPVDDPTLTNLFKNIGTGNSISIFLDPAVAVRISTNPHSMKQVARETASFSNQIVTDIHSLVPKDVLPALSGKIATNKDGTKIIKWSLDRSKLPAQISATGGSSLDPSTVAGIANQNKIVQDKYQKIENSLNRPDDLGPNAIGKSLGKFYELSRLYGDNRYLPGVSSSDEMLQNIIDSVIVKPEAPQE